MTPQEQLDSFKRQLQTAADEKARRRQEAEKNAVFQQIGQYLNAALSPLKEAVKQMVGAANDMKRVASSIDRISDITIPEPQIHVDLSSIPAPQVTVTPRIDFPAINIPDEMNVRGFVSLMGYDRGLLTNPLPVQLRDAKGNPVKLFENLTTLISGGGGGGGFQNVRVTNLNELSLTVAAGTNTTVSLVNADGTYYDSANPLPVTLSSTTQQVQQVSGAIDSVNLTQVGGASVQVGSGEGDNALRIYHATDSVASVNIVSGSTGGTQYNDGGNAEPGTGGLFMARDSAGSVYATRIGSGTSETALRVIQAVDSISSVSIASVQSSIPVIQVSGATDSVSIVSNIASLDVRQVSGSIDSVNIVSSATLTVTGSLTSVVCVGPTVGDAVDGGNAPLQIGGIARTANPTAVAGGDVVKASMDDIGRQIIRPVQVRDLIATAYVSLTNGTETTLLAGSASTLRDLIYVMGTNNSDAAVTVDLRSETGAGIVTSIRIPADGTAGVSLSVPIPQNTAAAAWTADLPDITGTTVTLSALFSNEV